MMNIVLDTNCLLMSLSRRSQYYPIWHHKSLARFTQHEDGPDLLSSSFNYCRS